MVLLGNRLRAKDIFLRNKRFDLIFKYLYLKNHFRYSRYTHFFEDCYCEHIRAFNDFYEDYPSQGYAKKSKDDFIQSFTDLFYNIKSNGFDENISRVAVDSNFELLDASHRVAICTFLDMEVSIELREPDVLFNYDFFLKNGIDRSVADYAALEYVKFNENSYIVNLHSITNPENDHIVEAILLKYGFIYYRKDIDLNFNGYVNLKKLSYGSDFFQGASWIGSLKDNFSGAQKHAIESMGKHPLRAYIFVCDNLNNVKKAKEEIRDIYGIGNFSIHINDDHEEAVQLAQVFFNDNSLYILNNRPFSHDSGNFDSLVDQLKKYALEQNVDLDDICASGSSPFSIVGIRDSRDLDFLYCGDLPFHSDVPIISNHDSEILYYPHNKVEIIKNPKYHFYYKGVKFITLDVLYEMKHNRNEKPKDINDCKLIKDFKNNKKPFKLVLFKKERIGEQRKITFCNFSFSYTRKRKLKK